MHYVIDTQGIENYKVSDDLAFGKVKAPLMLETDISFEHPIPETVEIKAVNNLSLDPFCSTLHYGQSIFEGLKAYKSTNQESVIFRLDEHLQRFERSAQIMKMAPISFNFLKEALMKYVECSKEIIPTKDGHALYLRPMMFANDPIIKVQSSLTYKFLILGSIVGDYFAKNKDLKTKVLLSDKFVRALPGGTGEAKTAANYAQSLPSLSFANSLGFQQVIYVDALERKNIEELGGMNFFWIENNTLCTPPLDGQILRGVTRSTVLELAREVFSLNTEEKKITRDELIEKTLNGQISEVFATGTAAVMTPLNEIGIWLEKENKVIKTLKFNSFPIMEKIKTYLIKTQRGETDHSIKYLTYI